MMKAFQQAPAASSPRNFITHIGGLRGLAILFIVIYHLGKGWVPCGQFGVDIFFVISGFFLFAGIEKACTENSFRLLGFYKRKFNRILPSLLVLLAILTVVVVVEFTSDCLKTYAETALAALCGLANKYLDFFTEGYFTDRGGPTNPLKHLWYISVVLQMYLILPLLILLLRRLPAWLRRSIWSVLGAISFLYFYHDSPTLAANSPTWVAATVHGLFSLCPWLHAIPLFNGDDSPYYPAMGRLWEFLAGGGALLLPGTISARGKQAAAWFGLLCIVLSVFIRIPGNLFTLPAVIGTVLLLAYGGSGRLLPAVLGNRAMLWFGAISYSLYLWHWPVKVCCTFFREGRPKSWEFFITFPLSVLLAWGAWKWVESRRFRPWQTIALWLLCLASAAGISYAPDAVFNTIHPGTPQVAEHRYTSSRLLPTELIGGDLPQLVPGPDFYGGGFLRNSYSDDHNDALLMRIGNEAKAPNFILMGDSHANAYFPALDTLGREEGFSGIYLRSYLIPFMGIEYTFSGVNAFMNMNDEIIERQLAWLNRHPELRTIILCQYWGLRTDNNYPGSSAKDSNGTELTGAPIPVSVLEPALRAYCRRVKEIGKELVIVAPGPELEPAGNLPLRHINSSFLLHRPIPAETISMTQERYQERNAEIIAALERLEKDGLCHLLRLAPALFPNGETYTCHADGELLMRDTNHLTPAGATRIMRALLPSLKEMLPKE